MLDLDFRFNFESKLQSTSHSLKQIAMSLLSIYPHWESLPNELWCMILSSISDLQTLSNAISAFPSLYELFNYRHQEIFGAVLENSRPYQFSKIISAILILRYDRPFKHLCPEIRPAEALGILLSDALEGNQGRIDVPFIEDPLWALQEIARLCEDTQLFIQAFIQSRWRRPTNCTSHSISQPPPPHLPEPKPVIEYRTRRAFWRFWLICELQRVSSKRSQWPLCFHDTFTIFFRGLTNWEIEEMVGIYFFIRDLCTRNPFDPAGVIPVHYNHILLDPIQHYLIQRLLYSMGYESLSGGLPVIRLDHHIRIALEFLCVVVPPYLLDRPPSTEPRTFWSDAPFEANAPSEEDWPWYCPNQCFQTGPHDHPCGRQDRLLCAVRDVSKRLQGSHHISFNPEMWND